jgi:hypothetical protein
MSTDCAAEVCGRFLWEGDTSNKPFEWSGHHQPSAAPPQASCLPLKGSVQAVRGMDPTYRTYEGHNVYYELNFCKECPPEGVRVSIFRLHI